MPPADPGPPRRKPPNPFYTLLLLSSSLFALTALAYYISPIVAGQAELVPRAAGPERPSRALAEWLDRRGPLLLGIEMAVMILAGAAAMATEGWSPTARGPGD